MTIASQRVWFCGEHAVKKIFFEDLRDFQQSSELDSLSWAMSMNLWGRIIDSVRYMRETLGPTVLYTKISITETPTAPPQAGLVAQFGRATGS